MTHVDHCVNDVKQKRQMRSLKFDILLSLLYCCKGHSVSTPSPKSLRNATKMNYVWTSYLEDHLKDIKNNWQIQKKRCLLIRKMFILWKYK